MSWVSRSGSLGVDHSANASTVPISGYALLITVAANTRRNFMEVQNQSTDLIQLVRDDGLNNNITTILLSGAPSSGAQGANWTSDTFKGRLRIYAPNSTDQVACYED